MTEQWNRSETKFLGLENNAGSCVSIGPSIMAARLVRNSPDDHGLLPYTPWQDDRVLNGTMIDGRLS
jgi:hypothetical protein